MLLSFIAYIVSRRLYNNSNDALNVTLLGMLTYIALIWSNQFHFSPQDFNIVILMLLIVPLLPLVVRGNVNAIGLLSLIAVSLTLTHQTEVPILIASLFTLLLLKLLEELNFCP